MAKQKKVLVTEPYNHPEATSPLRPEIGTQAQFKKKKPPTTYLYDSSFSPSLEWDGKNAAREKGEALLKEMEELSQIMHSAPEDEYAALTARMSDLIAQLKAMSRPFLNWSGKAERLSFDVPTLPLFVHERLSTKAILETLRGHRRDKQVELEFFGDTSYSIADQILKAYEYQDKWVNRMILGDSLVVMNSLLEYEGLGSQVQMIYIDPPYGVKFGSNFQPFVRKREVTHNDDDDMTREPEMVKAYRDTWELGLHSYLTHLRDRLLLSRELLSASGSVFVQISDDHVHHVRELLDETFGAENFIGIITFAKTSGFSSSTIATIADYILWYAKDSDCIKYHPIFRQKEPGDEGATKYRPVDSIEAIPAGRFQGTRLATLADLTAQGESLGTEQEFEFNGRTWKPPAGLHWKTTVSGMRRLADLGRIVVEGKSLRFVRFLDDFPVYPLANIWTDIGGIQNRAEGKLYVVQTAPLAIERCMLMTTDPGDLVLDPTCGSGTTAYVAETWGRRWITVDTSRVPLALARQRLLTATYPYYELQEDDRGPAGGFIYRRKQNQKGEEVGGIVPHVTLRSLANDEPPGEEVLVDRPDIRNSITRITGPFCVEATIPTPVDWEGDGEEDSGAGQSHGAFVQRMIDVLKRSPILHLSGGKAVELKNIRVPIRTLSLSAEAVVDASSMNDTTLGEAIAEVDEENKGMLPLSKHAVAIVFGPENGAISEKLVYEAAKEAAAKRYRHLFVIGFAVQAHARQLIDNADKAVGVAATYVQATPDLMMGDLLKNMRSSQIFSVCGLPDIKVCTVEPLEPGDPARIQVELIGFDVFDPATMQVTHKRGNDVPAWLLDTDYNEQVFHVSQAFFPRTGAWENLKRALRTTHESTVWDHLSGTVSAPFETGEHKRIAVKVIDDRGNELMVVRDLENVS